ncbi:helix-turn-helix domain-containing protein [Ralstonia solanacearum]|uniref:helix-turn-helix domain-containing protein n=1 Tax=Ralstonia solanacearum TaxID=305 RepID=UPI00168BD35F|nr:helix-turn-helix domain-containing protein [Ralstonia solanacearum]QNT25242.1 helix-turn-helix domain-containing protein [Ralstonia solanacearum]QNT62886.1 helix-turn-helix domain-containing protein [Ralstonia solanacearum]
MTDEPDQALTIRSVALLLNVTEKTIYRLAQKRELPGFKVAGTWRFMRGDILQWIEARKSGATIS